VASDPTIYDVARAAGVSAATVSRTFSRPGRVSSQTAARVRAAADEVGYGASPVAPGPADRRTGVILLMVSDLANPAYHGIVRGAEEAAEAAGRLVLVGDGRESAEVERAILTRSLAVADGVVLAGSRMTDTAIRMVAKQVPLVALNRLVPDVPSLTIDQTAGARRALEHLHGLGHAEVTYLAGPEASWADGSRWRSASDVAGDRGLRIRRLGPFDPTVRGGMVAVHSFRSAPTTAVLAFNDLLAAGFVHGVLDAGGSVPDDVSVVSFDDTVAAELVRPGLTTVASPVRDLGAMAVRALLQTLEKGRLPALRPVALPTRLVERGSTAQPSRNSTSPAWWTTSVSGSAS
jgi:LacI family repressor for deo operon, udp, cdd, tsx, nupC, and nupG